VIGIGLHPSERVEVFLNSEQIEPHATNHSPNGNMRSVVDSKHWADIDRRYEDFAAFPVNCRLGLVGDGVNPYKY
jgi:hypothetical protein